MPVRVDVAEQAPQGRGPRWLAWLAWAVVALLLAVAFWLLLGACGIRMLHGLPMVAFCPGSSPAAGLGPGVGGEIARQHALEAEIERLELALLRAPDCPARDQAEVAPTPAPIPEEAWNERDIGFLEGCWELETDYRVRNVETQKVRRAESWQACFDAEGRGQQTLTFDDGTQCQGPMTGQFGADGRLQLNDTGDLPCADGFRIFERHTTCERVDAQHAQCDQYQPRTGGRGDVTFRHRAEADQ